MTPVYLSQSASSFPFVDLNKDEHLQHFTELVPNYQAATSSSHHDQRQKQSSPEFHQIHHQHKDITYDLESESSDHHAMSSSSICPVTNNSVNDDGSMKWMATKVRLQIRKIVSSSTNDHQRGKSTEVVRENSEHFTSKSTGDIVRVCSDCNTTKTPLWRSGPCGPKSLCNACGIRQRKARRALAAAAEAATNSTEMGATSSTTYSKVHNNEKKLQTTYAIVTQKRKSQESDLVNNTASSTFPQDSKVKRVNKFEEFAISLSKNSGFRRVFPRDEEEAAILLMALSCGLVHG